MEIQRAGNTDHKMNLAPEEICAKFLEVVPAIRKYPKAKPREERTWGEAGVRC